MPDPLIPRPTFRPTAPTTTPNISAPVAPQLAADIELFGQPIDLPNDPADAVVKSIQTAVEFNPLTIGAGVLSHTPTGWLPGGADEQFRDLGERLRVEHPDKYRDWLAVKETSDKDFFGGGNQKADFNNEMAEFYDSLSKEGTIGALAQPTSSGSLGGLLVHGGGAVLGASANAVMRAVTERLGLPPETRVEDAIALLTAPGGIPGVLGTIGGKALTDDKWRAAALSALTAGATGQFGRMEELERGAALGATLSDLEGEVLEKVQSGEWTKAHGLDVLTRRGQAYTDDPWLQIAGATISDPLLYAGAAPGLLGKATAAGRAISEVRAPVGLAETTKVNMARMADDAFYGPIFRLMGQVVNPHLPDSASTAAKVSLQSADGLGAFDRVYRGASTPLRQLGQKYGILPQIERAIADYVQHTSVDAAAAEVQRLAVRNHLGEELAADGGAAIEDIAKPLTTAMTPDAMDQYVEQMTRTAHDVVQKDDLDQLARRLVSLTGGAMPMKEAEKVVADASPSMRSALHAITHKTAEREFFTEVLPDVNLEQLAAEADIEPATLARLTLMNTRTLDTELAAEILKDVTAEKNLTLQASVWNEAARRYPAIGRIGYASGKSEAQMNALLKDLDELIAERGIPRRFDQLDSPAAQPISDWLDRQTVDGQPLWRLGFLPEGPTLKRATSNGRYVVDRAPTIGRDWDGVAPRFEPLRGHGLDTLASYGRKLTDSTTSMQLAINTSKRFTRFAESRLGLPEADAQRIWSALTDHAGQSRTTIRGLQMGKDSPVWNLVKQNMPEGHLMPDGSVATPREVLDEVLRAAEGDMDVFGPLPVLTQRMRNALRWWGVDRDNYSGWVTGTVFNKMRYANPIFLAQRLTDAPFFMALKGQAAVIGGVGQTQAVRDTRDLMQRVARTDWARAFAMDLPEFATRSNYVDLLTATLVKAAGGESRLVALLKYASEAPDGFIANNMAKMVYNNMGKAVRDTLSDRARLIGEIADPELRAAMEEEIGLLERNFGDLRRLYSQQEGRLLDDNEVGLKFILSHFDSMRKFRLTPEGNVDMSGFLREIEQGLPSDAADLGRIYPEELAHSLGYADAAALRSELAKEVVRDPTGRVIAGTDPAGLREQLVQAHPNAHPDYIDRAVDYFSSSWDDFAKEVTDESKAVFLTADEWERAAGAIARIAEGRGMDPWEYLTGVIKVNLANKHRAPTLIKHLKGLARALTPEGDPSDIMRYFAEGHIDPSGQRALLGRFVKSPEGKALGQEMAAKDLARQAPPVPGRAAPAEAGTAPLEPGMVRAYHYTSDEQALAQIRTKGLRQSAAKGETYGEPNQVWFSTQKPNGDKPFVEVHLRPEEITGTGGPPPNLTPEALAEWADKVNKSGSNFAVAGDIGADRIVAFNEDWMTDYRSLVNDGPSDPAAFREQFGWGLEGKWKDTPVGRAIAKRMAELEPPVLPEPWRTGPYADKTEEVSVEELSQFMEIDRELRGKGYTGLDYLDKLTEDIRLHGYEEPLEFAYDPETGLGLLSDGNHRLAVAKRLGLDRVPVRGVRVKGLGSEKQARPIKARIQPNEDGYIPGDLTPTEVGLTALPPKQATAAAPATAWTPLTKAPRVPRTMYAHTAANGGGTFDAATGKEMGLTKGYGVANGPLGKVVENKRSAVDAAYREVAMTGAPHIGTWVNPADGMVYVDPTQVVDDLDEALTLARARGEKAIFDYSTYEDIPVTPELTAESLMEHRFPEALAGRLQSGRPNPNPDVEAIYRAFGQWYRRAVQPSTANKKLIEMLGEMPEDGAAPFSRSEAMTMSLLKDQLGHLGNDSFFVAEMATKRSLLMRSINHPILGLYPPAYFWGKVMPLTLKLLARNPYGLTVDALALQRQIALQRALDPEFDEALDDIGSSEVAYVLDYLTPGTPMGGYEVHGPRWMEDLTKGHWEKAADDLTKQINPLRTTTPFIRAAQEVADALQDLLGGGESQGLEGYPTPTFPEPAPTAEPTSLVPALETAQAELTAALG